MDYINYLEVLGVLNDSIAISRTLKGHGCWLFNVPSPLTTANLNRPLENIMSRYYYIKEGITQRTSGKLKQRLIHFWPQPTSCLRNKIPIIISVLLLEQIPRMPYYALVSTVPDILLVLQKVLNNIFKLDVTRHM